MSRPTQHRHPVGLSDAVLASLDALASKEAAIETHVKAMLDAPVRPIRRPVPTTGEPTCLQHDKLVARMGETLIHVADATACDSDHVIYPLRECAYPVTQLMPVRGTGLAYVPVLHIRHPLLDAALCGAEAKQTKAEAVVNGLTAAQSKNFTPCEDCCAARDALVGGTRRGDLAMTL
jgi:hypothetical protein